MSTAYEIPLTPEPQQIRIVLAATNYRLTVYWCQPAGAWIFDLLTDAAVPIISGIAIVTGVDLLAQFGYLEFGGQLVAQTDHDLTAPPDRGNLGITGHLYFVVN